MLLSRGRVVRRRRAAPSTAVAEALLGIFALAAALTPEAVDAAGGDAIEARPGHVCGSDCWHRTMRSEKGKS